MMEEIREIRNRASSLHLTGIRRDPIWPLIRGTRGGIGEAVPGHRRGSADPRSGGGLDEDGSATRWTDN